LKTYSNFLHILLLGQHLPAEKMSRRFQPTNILDLNDDALKSILSHLSFDEVAQMRLVYQLIYLHLLLYIIVWLLVNLCINMFSQVCRRLHDISQEVLNSGFARIKQHHIHCKKKMKTMLPRRESDRRIHPLNTNFEILYSIPFQLLDLNIVSWVIFFL